MAPILSKDMDAPRRKTILNRYLYHTRRFDEVAARARSESGPVAPAAPLREALERTPTRRELEVLELVAEGFINREIAKRLGLSEETVKSHLRKLLARLAAQSRAHAVAVGFRRGLLT